MKGFAGVLLLIIITAAVSAVVTYIGFVSVYQYKLAQANDKIATLQGKISDKKAVTGGTGEASTTPTPTPSKDQKTVKLYFYNQGQDKKDNDGSTTCDTKYIQPLNRTIDANSKDPMKDTINLLLKGELSQDEQNQGFVTSLPGDGFTLTNDDLSNGTLTLTFDDPNHFAKGSSCHTSGLKEQIIQTGQQFDGVKSVVIKPDSLFE
jgi:spore germination protein GerM